MSSAIKEKKGETQDPIGTYKEIWRGPGPIDLIEVKGNFRRNFNKERLQELADNIKKVGVLEPILLRRDGEQLILIAGERRLRAAKMAGLKEIPGRVLDVNPEQAAEIQALENLHREDLGPIEEACAFKTLLDQAGYDVKALAQRIDKSEGYVYKALKLLEIPEAGIRAIEEAQIPVSFGHEIARTAPQYQERLVKYATTKHQWSGKYPTLHDLQDEIEKTVQKPLSRALFPTKEPYAGELACAACPFNTGNQELLVPGVEDGQCTNGACFGKKQRMAEKDFETKAAARFKGLESLGTCRRDYSGNPVPPKNGIIIDREQAGKLKKQLESNPEKFGYVVAKPSNGYGGSKGLAAYLVCKDSSILPAKVKTKNENSGAPRLTQEELAREQFVRGAVDRALACRAVELTQGKKASLADIWKTVLTIDDLVPSGIMHAVFKLEDEAGWSDYQEAMKKATEAQIYQIIYLSTRFDNGYSSERDYKAMGVDVAKVTKEAKTQALAQWVKEHADAKAKKA